MGIIQVKCEYCGLEKKFQMVNETNVKSGQTESLFSELVKVNGDLDTIKYEDIIRTRYYDHCPACRWSPLKFWRVGVC